MRVALVLVFFLFISNIQASHVMGGHFEVKNLGGNTYQIDFYGQIDCVNGVPGFGFTPNRVRLFENGTNTFIQFIDLTLGTLTIDTVQLGDSCYNPGLCVEEWHYSRTVNLPSNAVGYYLTYDICCRNIIIDNIIYPNFNGHTFYIEIPPSSIPSGNSSPVYQPYNVDAYFCIDKMKCYDLSAFDPDGDSLVYSIITPLDEDSTGKPFDSLKWKSGYDENNPLGGSGFMYMDSSTGQMCAKGGYFGEFVFTIKIEEYRNGVKIGEVHHDYQWEVLNCDMGTNINYPFLNDTQVVYIDEPFCIDIVAEDLTQPNDTLIILYSGNVLSNGAYLDLPAPVVTTTVNMYDFTYLDQLGNEVTDRIEGWKTPYSFNGIGKVGMQLCWNPIDCDLYELDSIYLDLITFSNRCVGSDTVPLRVNFKMFDGLSHEGTPNVFSPNGDGKNDYYKLIGKYQRCFDVLNAKIYNRWGRLVYETDDPDFAWDGNNFNGKPLEQGTYYILLQGFYGKTEVTDQFPVTLFR